MLLLCGMVRLTLLLQDSLCAQILLQLLASPKVSLTVPMLNAQHL